MTEFSLDNVEKAKYKFGDRVTITVTKDVNDEYAIAVDDGGVDLNYTSLPREYHTGCNYAVFERGAGSLAGRWFVATDGDYIYINECERHSKARTEFVLNCAEEGIGRLVEIGYIPKPVELTRDTVNRFSFHGVTVTATPVCGGKYQLRVDIGDTDVSAWNTREVGGRTIHVWPSGDYEHHLYVGTSLLGTDISVKVPFTSVASTSQGCVDNSTAVDAIESLRDYVNEMHKRGELVKKKIEAVVTKVGEVTFTVVDVGDGEVELSVEVPDETENYPWFNPMGTVTALRDHELPTLVPHPLGGSYRLWDGHAVSKSWCDNTPTQMPKTEADEIINFVKDAYQKYDEAVKKWAPPMNAPGKIKNEWVESRKPDDVHGNTFSTKTGELASDGQFFGTMGYFISDSYYPIYAPSGEYAGYFECGEFVNATVHN